MRQGSEAERSATGGWLVKKRQNERKGTKERGGRRAKERVSDKKKSEGEG